MTFSFFVLEKWKLFVWNIGSTQSPPLSKITGGKRNGTRKKQRRMKWRIFWTTLNSLFCVIDYSMKLLFFLNPFHSFLLHSNLVVRPVIRKWSCGLMNVGSFFLTWGCQKLECCSVISLLLGASWIEMSICVCARICQNSFCNFLLQLFGYLLYFF